MLNPYFNNYNARNEQLLLENLTIEAIQMMGINIIYLPLESVETDKLFGEDIIAKYEKTYQIEAYFENITEFEGQNNIYTNLGIVIDKLSSFTFSRRRFKEIVKNRQEPIEGDLIYFPMTSTLFEINRVSNTPVFYQAGKRYVWKVECELYTASNDTFNTKYKDIDMINTENGNLENILRADNIEIEQEAASMVIDNSTIDSIINTFDPNDPFGQE